MKNNFLFILLVGMITLPLGALANNGSIELSPDPQQGLSDSQVGTRLLSQLDVAPVDALADSQSTGLTSKLGKSAVSDDAIVTYKSSRLNQSKPQSSLTVVKATDIEGVFDFKKVMVAVMANHPALSGKRAEVSAKEFASDTARAARYPSLTGQAGYQNLGAQAGARGSNQAAFTLRARQPLWAFGRIDDAIDYADADVLVDQADLLRVKRDLMEKTTVAYAQVLGVYQRQQVIADNIKSHKSFYRNIQRRELGQLASSADSRLAFLRLMQARAHKKRAQGELLLVLNELQSLAQIPIHQVLPIAEDVIESSMVMNQVEALALDHSANLHHKKRLLALAEAKTEKEMTASMPTVYLQAVKQFNQIGTGNATSYSIMIDGGIEGMGLPAFGRTKAAGAQEMAARENIKVTRNELIRNVRSLLRNRQLQQDLIKVYSQSVFEFRAILQSYMRQYEAGRKAWLEVLNMQRELTEQRLQLAQAKNDKLVYSLRLAALIGGFDKMLGIVD